MTVRVLAFARLREGLGFSERSFDLAQGATVEDVWNAATAGWGESAALRASTRFARNGELASAAMVVRDGDEIAFLPPVGGG
jgi:molybdopterin converting factor small subunit